MGLGVITGQVVQASDVSLLARIRGVGGQLITAESLASIAWTASDLTAGVQLGAGTWAPASVVFDSLVTGDPRWSMDSADQPGSDQASGYNFLATIAAGVFPATTLSAQPIGTPASNRVQVDVHFTDTAGGNWRVVWAWTPIAVYG